MHHWLRGWFKFAAPKVRDALTSKSFDQIAYQTYYFDESARGHFLNRGAREYGYTSRINRALARADRASFYQFLKLGQSRDRRTFSTKAGTVVLPPSPPSEQATDFLRSSGSVGQRIAEWWLHVDIGNIPAWEEQLRQLFLDRSRSVDLIDWHKLVNLWVAIDRDNASRSIEDWAVLMYRDLDSAERLHFDTLDGPLAWLDVAELCSIDKDESLAQRLSATVDVSSLTRALTKLSTERRAILGVF